MSFKVPELEAWRSGSKSGSNASVFAGRSAANEIFSPVGDNSGAELGEEAAAAPDTVYPTKMTGIIDNTASAEEEALTLKKINQYEGLMNDIGESFATAAKGMSESELLQDTWGKYEDQVKEVHKTFLEEQAGKKTAKLFGQSFVEHLSAQRELYEKRLAAVTQQEKMVEFQGLTDGALKKVLLHADNLQKVSDYSKKAFDQACEEAVFMGKDDEAEIASFAKKRLLGTIDAVLNQQVAAGNYKSASMYLKSIENLISNEDRAIIDKGMHEHEVVSKIQEYMAKGDIESAEQLFIIQPERIKKLARVVIRRSDKINSEEEARKQRSVIEEARKNFEDSGVVKTYALVGGKLEHISPEIYDGSMDADNHDTSTDKDLG